MYVKDHGDPTSHGISSNSNWLSCKSSDLKKDMRMNTPFMTLTKYAMLGQRFMDGYS